MNAFARVTEHPSAILLVVQLLSVMAYPFMEDTAAGRPAFGVLGVVALMLSLVGFMFEYYRGDHAH